MKTETIEVDETTAAALRTRATELGISVSELVKELTVLDNKSVAADTTELAELDRRWKAVELGGVAVPHDEVVRWLRTWGTPAFRPWHER